jgi:glycosyltransferase involved in cell wall biosynthesis
MPGISVVMAVYNGGAELAPSLDSVLAQSEGDFELIVVDDGSSDATPDVLRGYAARDARLCVIRQDNAGLTAALIRGCAEARGEIIVRQDCGDRSHPERFARQAALLRGGVIVASCAVRYIAPAGEYLYSAMADGDEVRSSLLHDPPERIHGIPHHGSAMFLRAAYVAAGGYRPQFRFAQDLDLWIRMARIGAIAVTAEELYEATIGLEAISSGHRPDQRRLAAIAVALRDGGDEASLLAEAAQIRPAPRAKHVTQAAALYFIAKNLRRQRNPLWRRYLLRAIRRNPLHVRAWLSLVQR